MLALQSCIPLSFEDPIGSLSLNLDKAKSIVLDKPLPKEESHITPFHQPERLGRQTIKFATRLKSYDVADPTDTGIRLGPIGGIINGISGIFGELIVSFGMADEPHIENFEFDIPEIDRDVLKEVRINRVSIVITERDSKSTKLSFIEDFKLKLKVDGVAKDFAHYRYSRDKTKDKGKRIDINVSNENLLDLIPNNSKISLIPSLNIKDIPSNMKITAEIDFEITIEAPI